MQQLNYNTTRQTVHTTRGVQLPIKYHRGWKYINYEGKKIGVNTLPKITDNVDEVFNYIFSNGFQTNPCPAMDYWIYHHRMGNRITVDEYKVKFKINKRKCRSEC